MVPLTVRIPAELLARLDAHAAKLSRERPGFVLTRSDVARVLMERALGKEKA
jgi:hypothetical protein